MPVPKLKSLRYTAQASLRLISVVILTGAYWAVCGETVFSQESDTLPTGLPKSVKNYVAERDRLRAADVALKFDAALDLTANEQILDERLSALLKALTKEYRTAKRFPPAEPFHRVKEEIRGTALYRLLRQMPKGGVLHLHTSSTAPAAWIVGEGIREPDCFVCWPDNSGASIKGQLGFFRPDKAPAGYQRAQDVLANDVDFPGQLLDLITINESDVKLTNLGIWQKFNAIFQRVDGLLSYQPLFLKYYRAAFRTLCDDNVSYVELRAGFSDLHDLNGKTWDAPARAMLMWEIRNEIRKTNPLFDLKLIYSGYRGASAADVWKQIEQAIQLRTAWKDQNFILGFDLVGDEDAGHRTEAFLADWVRLTSYLAEKKTTLPFYFHDGESNWQNDTNLYDAFLLGSRRIGHGFDLFRFPTLQAEMRRNRIAIEVCPISNQQLLYCSDLRTHPAVGYLNQGIPIVLSNDDPGIFGNDGLTFDFWEATVAWKLDLAALKQLAWNSLQYSGMTETEKSVAVAHWRQAWDRWVDASLASFRS